MKGSFPRDCLISAYLRLLAKHSHGMTDAEFCGNYGRSLNNQQSGNFRKCAGLVLAAVNSPKDCLCNIVLDYMEFSLLSSVFLFFCFFSFIVILCLNIFPPLYCVRKTDFISKGLYKKRLFRKCLHMC